MEIYGEQLFVHHTNICEQMMKAKNGFTLIELLVAIAIFVVVIAIPFNMFIKTLNIANQQYEISKSSVEKLPVSEILIKDIETAGFGLPYKIGDKKYSEVSDSISFPLYVSFRPSTFNNSPSGIPKAIDGDSDSSSGYSYLVLRGSVFGLSKAANHWTYIYYDNKTGTEKINIWNENSTSNYNNLAKDDEVIILNAATRKIVGNSLFYKVAQNASSLDENPIDYGLPGDLPPGNYLVYGINSNNNVSAPFNRIDYALYDGQNSGSLCAQGTHTLYRIVFNNNGTGSVTMYPILRCVADFEVWFGLDNNSDSIYWTKDLTSLPALKVRQELKRVVVFILIQNGQVDESYTYPSSWVSIGDNNTGIKRNTFYFSKHGFLLTGPKSYKHYRWKLLEFVIKPMNLEGD